MDAGLVAASNGLPDVSMGSWRASRERILEASPLDWIQGRIRKRVLLTMSCKLRGRWSVSQPTKRSRGASFQALAQKLMSATSCAPAKIV